MAEENNSNDGREFDDRPDYALEPKLFGKWSYEGVECSDMSLGNYCQVKTVK